MTKLSIWKNMGSYVPRKNSSLNKKFKKNIFRIHFETYINPKIAKNIIWSIMKINIQLSKWCVRDEILIMSIVLLYPRVIFAICLTVCLIKEHWFNKLYLGFISGLVLERFFSHAPLTSLSNASEKTFTQNRWTIRTVWMSRGGRVQWCE